MPTQKPITLKMSTAPAYGYTSVKQMDVEGVELILTLKNSNDSDYDLTPGSTLFFKMANESGSVKVTLSELDDPNYITRAGDNVVKVLLTEEMVAETGVMACELQEMYDGSFTSTQLFYLRVWPTTEDGEIIISPEFKSLVSAYLYIEEALDKAELAKNFADGLVDAEFAREAAELIREENEAARIAAENLRGLDIETMKVKISKFEQENAYYRKLLEDSNPTQSPRVSSGGYGVVSLPKNAGQGPMDVKVEGLSYKNELNYDITTMSNWGVDTGVVKTANKIRYTTNGSRISQRAYIATNLKPNTNYVLILNILENTSTIANTLSFENFTIETSTTIASAGQVGTIKFIFTTRAHIGINRVSLNVGYNNPNVGQVVSISDIRIIELPAGSQIETDANTYTADELALKYPYVQGGEPRNTSGTFRVKSVGKNLFDYRKYAPTLIGSNSTVTYDNGVYEYRATATNHYGFWLGNVPVKRNTNYTVSSVFTLLNGTLTPNNHGVRIQFNDTQSYSNFGASGVITFNTGENDSIRIMYYAGAPNTDSSVRFRVEDIMLEESSVVTTYEPYISSEQYVNSEELRSLPNGVADSVEDGKLIKRVSDDFVLQPSMANWFDKTTFGKFDYIRYPKSEIPNSASWANPVEGMVTVEGWEMEIAYTQLSSLGTPGCFATEQNSILLLIEKGQFADLSDVKANFQPVALTYQLAEPIEIPIEVSGSLHSYPSGTVYVEPAIADVGVYSGGVSILKTDYPIHQLESISKIDFDTGLPTEIDTSTAVIAPDGLTFTHSALSNGDIVFFTYLYDDSIYTAGKATCEYYDSRFVLKDDVTGKFYKEVKKVENGELVTQLVEV